MRFDGRLLHKEYDQYTFSSRINDTKNPNHSHDPSQPKFLSHPSIGQGDSVLLGFPLQFSALIQHFDVTAEGNQGDNVFRT